MEENNEQVTEKKGFSLDNYLNKKFELNEMESMTEDEIFNAGFTAYATHDSIFLKLIMHFNVKTTCPINASEDIIKVKVEYRANRYGEVIEHHSFLRWIDSFKEKGLGLESTCSRVYEMIEKVVSPTQLKVTTYSQSNYQSLNIAIREKDTKESNAL